LPAIESGRAPFSQGLIEPARTRARRLVDELESAPIDERDVLLIEPSDLGMLRREYARLLPASTARRVATSSFDLLEYVVDREDLLDRLRAAKATGRVVYHPHCQARTLGVDAATVTALETAGFEVVSTTAECCGMAGSFGFKSQFYELSMAVGASLAEEVDGLDGDILAASGTSCLDQLDAVTSAEPVHPVVLLADALDSTGRA
ncbi:MAG: (Fe-S)-binding protein, partial [Halobacteriota archaeon]